MKHPIQLGLVASMALMVGCSSFNRDWDALADASDSTDDIVGRWDGTWTSEQTGHSGRLRCIVTRIDEQHYDARFHAVYGAIFTFGYDVPLEVKPDEGGVSFRGSADLGFMAGGEYRYRGEATPTDFKATYHAESDHGTFAMKRPVNKPK